MTNDVKIITLEEAKSIPGPKGKLLSIEMSSWSSGMMMNSGTKHSIKLDWSDGKIMLTKADSTGWEGDITRLYRALESDAAAICAVAARENLASWENLREIPPAFQIMDYSSGASIALVYELNDPERSWQKTERFTINTTAARQLGGGEVIDELYAILNGCCREENLISEEKTPPKNNLPGFMGINQVPEKETIQEAEDSWKCSFCGTMNTGKFCCECGVRKP
ncbi:MAG: hypothetical protein IIY45_15495 [Firmicutes bacterium]|nr:hypothetical protein [Bacillota bacterium]